MKTYLIELYSRGHTRTCRCQAGSFGEAYEGAQAMVVDRAETDEPWEVIGVRRVEDRGETHANPSYSQQANETLRGFEALLNGIERGIE